MVILPNKYQIYLTFTTFLYKKYHLEIISSNSEKMTDLTAGCKYLHIILDICISFREVMSIITTRSYTPDWLSHTSAYSKCPKNSNIKGFDKMAYANSADPDQTAPQKAVWSGSTLFVIPVSIFRNNYIKNKIETKQEAHGPQLAHLIKTAIAYLQMPCNNILPVLS